MVGRARPSVPPPPPLLFRNVRVFDGRSGRTSGAMHVLVEGNVIVKMTADAIEPPAGAQVVEGAGRTLMPGLIDNHVHVVFSASTQPDLLDPKTSIDVLQARAATEAEQMLLRGFTAVGRADVDRATGHRHGSPSRAPHLPEWRHDFTLPC